MFVALNLNPTAGSSGPWWRKYTEQAASLTDDKLVFLNMEQPCAASPVYRQRVPARAGHCQVVVIGSLRDSWEQQRHRRPTTTGRRLAFLWRGERDGDPPACLLHGNTSNLLNGMK
jgi:hypothetical protein